MSRTVTVRRYATTWLRMLAAAGPNGHGTSLYNRPDDWARNFAGAARC
ncbi:MAG: hypothetical protein K2X82_05495 [Gemmataceae bacterium]|nr:hypothetical protein [Gemmataceae bacterium]